MKSKYSLGLNPDCTEIVFFYNKKLKKFYYRKKDKKIIKRLGELLK